MSRPVFVSVRLEMTPSGTRRPLEVTWEDGRVFEITSSSYLGRRAARSAGSGECWLCRIGAQEVPLYFSPLTGRWWMDGKGDPEPPPRPQGYRRVKDRDYKPPER